MTNRLLDVEALAPIANKPTGSCHRSVAWLAFAKKPIDRPLATAKDPAAAAKDVRCEARASDRVAQGQCTKYSSDAFVHMAKGLLKNVIAKIGEIIFARLSRINHPTLDSDTEISMEKVFSIDTAAPGMIRLQVAIILPIVPREKVSAPQTDVELVVRVPLRTRWGRHLLHLLSGIGFTPSNRCRGD